MPGPKKTVLHYERDVPEIEDRDPTLPPDQHLQKKSGSDDIEVVDGRRPSKMLLVSKLRDAVGEWRENGYPGASTTTVDLFRHWFSGASITMQGDVFAPYWGQREAIETLAYLIEVERVSDVKDLIEEFATAKPSTLLDDGVAFQTSSSDGTRHVLVPADRTTPDRLPIPPEDLPRFACKMATGSGKTLVMALVIAWSYLHSRREKKSPLSANFLVLAPNVIVYERLRVDFENGKVFRDLGLIPPGWKFDLRVILRGESAEPGGSGNLIVTNIQQLRESSERWEPKNAIDNLLGRKPTGNAATRGRSMLDRVRSLDRLMVLNDEAHHVHDDDLEWNKTLLELHTRLPHGLSAWLDFSATPRFSGGAHFPWIVVDYPLAQAVEDQIVKAPMILHLVDKADPSGVTGKNVIEKYGDWIVAGMKRLREHEKAFKALPGTKPVLFVMCETTKHADVIGDWLLAEKSFKLKDDEVLVIHTDSSGEIKKGDLDKLRESAREIDDPQNPVKVVVSVLMLREGWDVRNVTIVLGLRPGTAASKILPEQAVGRGLRLMPAARDSRQVLEVLGTPAFENFVRELEAEGVYIKESGKTPDPPIIVEPVVERSRYDIAIPQTTALLQRTYSRLSEFDPAKVDPLFTPDAANENFTLRVKVEDATYFVELDKFSIERPGGPLASELVAIITKKVEQAAHLTDKFADLYPLIEKYLKDRCFGKTVDLDDDKVRAFLADPVNQNRLATFLGHTLGKLTTKEQPLKLEAAPLLLSKTVPFTWRRQHTVLEKTVFNYVATFNPFETSFADFLQKCKDVDRFAALAETFTRFAVDYLKPSGAIGHYYPDWVAVQASSSGDVNWIVETKGRVWDGTEQKDAAIRYWCTEVTALTGEPWNYMRVDQPIFKPNALATFADLVDLISERSKAVDEQVLFTPEADSPSD